MNPFTVSTDVTTQDVPLPIVISTRAWRYEVQSPGLRQGILRIRCCDCECHFYVLFALMQNGCKKSRTHLVTAFDFCEGKVQMDELPCRFPFSLILHFNLC